jgi:hypothetical protein
VSDLVTLLLPALLAGGASALAIWLVSRRELQLAREQRDAETKREWRAVRSAQLEAQVEAVADLLTAVAGYGEAVEFFLETMSTRGKLSEEARTRGAKLWDHAEAATLAANRCRLAVDQIEVLALVDSLERRLHQWRRQMKEHAGSLGELQSLSDRHRTEANAASTGLAQVTRRWADEQRVKIAADQGQG